MEMKKLTFELSGLDKRLCIATFIRDRMVNILIDTGAKFPVWTGGVVPLLKVFPDAKRILRDRKFSGFGGTVTADVYKFCLKIGDTLEYPEMFALVYFDKNMPDLILGAGALNGMLVEFDYLNMESRSVIFKVKSDDSFVRSLKLKSDKNGEALVLEYSDNVRFTRNSKSKSGKKGAKAAYASLDADAADIAAAFRNNYERGSQV